jgi:hypothetical protein
MITLMQWGDRWLAGKAGPPLELEHVSCGQRVTGRFVCSGCGEELHARNTRLHAGPGLTKEAARTRARELARLREQHGKTS